MVRLYLRRRTCYPAPVASERTVTIVIPCFNEAERLRPEAVDALVEDPRVRALLVDDGSTDTTAELLASSCAADPERKAWLAMPLNVGKAEAVRRGLVHAIDAGAERVGYLDADFATPPEEVAHLLDEMERAGARVVLGSRVVRLGADVRRSPSRHLLGRVFATTASLVLDLPVYDTQCGAKVFAVDATLRAALARPFSSRWIFDVELLGRLVRGEAAQAPVTREQLLEVPLRTWHDVGGSKLRPSGMARAGVDLLSLAWRVRRRGGRGFFGPGE